MLIVPVMSATEPIRRRCPNHCGNFFSNIPGQAMLKTDSHEDGENHRPLAADIVGEHTAEQAVDAPTDDGNRNDDPGIGRNEPVVGRLEQLLERKTDG
jgi:hypothetical protein